MFKITLRLKNFSALPYLRIDHILPYLRKYIDKAFMILIISNLIQNCGVLHSFLFFFLVVLKRVCCRLKTVVSTSAFYWQYLFQSYAKPVEYIAARVQVSIGSVFPT